MSEFKYREPKETKEARVRLLTELIGRTLVGVWVIEDKGEKREILFAGADGTQWRMYHAQGCCESVTVEDIIGDLADLVGSPIVVAEEVMHEQENPEGVTPPERYQESFTWTFYKFATLKGYVTIRWYGASSGYYSENVSFERMEQPQP